jgi:hypothetical protein
VTELDDDLWSETYSDDDEEEVGGRQPDSERGDGHAVTQAPHEGAARRVVRRRRHRYRPAELQQQMRRAMVDTSVFLSLDCPLL